MAISMVLVAMKAEIATSACSLLAMTRQGSPAVRAPTEAGMGSESSSAESVFLIKVSQ